MRLQSLARIAPERDHALDLGDKSHDQSARSVEPDWLCESRRSRRIKQSSSQTRGIIEPLTVKTAIFRFIERLLGEVEIALVLRQLVLAYVL